MTVQSDAAVDDSSNCTQDMQQLSHLQGLLYWEEIIALEDLEIRRVAWLDRSFWKQRR